MTDPKQDEKNSVPTNQPELTRVTEADDDAVIDGVDPVYGAKARVLNRSVSCETAQRLKPL
jgi:hypothetical protein